MPYTLYFFEEEPLFNSKNLTKIRRFDNGDFSCDFYDGKATVVVTKKAVNLFAAIICESVIPIFEGQLLTKFSSKETNITVEQVMEILK